MREVNIVYGRSHNKGVAFVKTVEFGYSRWYVVQGGCTVNKTHDSIEEGCDVEELEDVDCMSSMEPINTIEQFEKFINS